MNTTDGFPDQSCDGKNGDLVDLLGRIKANGIGYDDFIQDAIAQPLNGRAG